MKLKTIIGSFLFLGLSSSVFAAQAIHFYPPERIDCKINASQQLECNGFNRDFLIEDTYTIDTAGKEETLSFYSAVAYLTPDQKESSIFFTYHDTKRKMVKLKSIHSTAKPNMDHGSWKKVNEDFYTCKDGYMNCSIIIS